MKFTFIEVFCEIQLSHFETACSILKTYNTLDIIFRQQTVMMNCNTNFPVVITHS